MKKYYLYSRDSKGKVRVLVLSVKKEEDTYTIGKSTGLLNGKLTSQPDNVITEGKAKRTSKEQAELEFASIVNKQLDKGYVTLAALQALTSEIIDPMDYNTIDALLPTEKTDASGNTMPMGAKDTNPIKEKDKEKGTDEFIKLLSRAWVASLKLDGVRTKAKVVTVGEDGEEELLFLSKSGKPYLGVTEHFRKDPELIAFAKKYKCELDGEFYVHGMPLSLINGHCQKEKYIPERHDQIKFYLFDMALPGTDALARSKVLKDLKFSNPRVVVVEHRHLIGPTQCFEYEQEAIDLGYEGVMLRTTTGFYEFKKRSNEMWKLKPFQDTEGTIVGISEGLREEDMCFIMKTDDGVEFKASIMGTREEKQAYRKDIENLKGKRGTYKFQNLTPDGVPFLPKFKCLREGDD